VPCRSRSEYAQDVEAVAAHLAICLLQAFNFALRSNGAAAKIKDSGGCRLWRGTGAYMSRPSITACFLRLTPFSAVRFYVLVIECA
jgi:hypothetical protein